MVATVEPYYDFLENDRGALMLVIEAKTGTPDRPRILFNGKDAAVFYRRPEEAVHLVEIPADVAGPLAKVGEILVSEMTEDGDYAAVYEVPVKCVQQLPATR